MRKLFCMMLVLVSLFGLSACKKDKEFTYEGISVQLDTSFEEFDVTGFALYGLQSFRSAFVYMENASKSYASINFDVNSLADYMNVSRKNASSPSANEAVKDEEGVPLFYYFTYEASVEGQTFSYMNVGLEGESHYYLFCFYSAQANFEKLQPQFIEWAKTIVVV